MEGDVLRLHAVHARLGVGQYRENAECVEAHPLRQWRMRQPGANVAPGRVRMIVRMVVAMAMRMAVLMPARGPNAETRTGQHVVAVAQQSAWNARDSFRRTQALRFALRFGIEQRGYEHVPGDAADRVEVQMSHTAASASTDAGCLTRAGARQQAR